VLDKLTEMVEILQSSVKRDSRARAQNVSSNSNKIPTATKYYAWDSGRESPGLDYHS
jgi:hypothetical protein